MCEKCRKLNMALIDEFFKSPEHEVFTKAYESWFEKLTQFSENRGDLRSKSAIAGSIEATVLMNLLANSLLRIGRMGGDLEDAAAQVCRGALLGARSALPTSSAGQTESRHVH